MANDEVELDADDRAQRVVASTDSSNARREREAEVAGTARPHRTRDTNKRWRWWASTDSSNARHEREVEVALTQHTLIEHETRTRGGGGTDTARPH